MFPLRNALSALTVSGLFTATLLAHGGAPYRGPEHLVPPPPSSAPQLVSEEVTARIFGASAETRVTFVFQSQHPRPEEAELVIPLPDETVVSNLRLTINDELVQAEVLDPSKARSIYEGIVRRQRDPALLEHIGHGCIRARIYPVSKGHDATVELTYLSTLRTVSGHREYVYPLRRLARRGDPLAHSVVMTIELETQQRLTALTSPTHDFLIRRDGERKATLSYESGDGTTAADVRLLFAEADTELGMSLLSTRSGNAAGTFLATLTPTMHPTTDPLPRDVVFVIDTSGSMRHAGKIDQARTALNHCIDALQPQDRFEVITFSDLAKEMLRGLQPVSEPSKEKAHWEVDRLVANGSTNFGEAMEKALRLQEEPSERSFHVFVLTDGRPTVGEKTLEDILDLVKKRARGSLRLFVFGVGYDVNAQLLDTLVERHGGEREYVLPNESIESKVTGLFAKVAEPFLHDVRFTIDGVETHDVYPPRVGDLYHGSSVTVTGRYEGGGSVYVRVHGKRGERDVTYVLEHVLEDQSSSLAFLPTLWAWRKIGFLMDQIRLNGEERELVDEVKRLGLEHGLVTPYTAALAVEPGMRGRAPGPGGDEFFIGRRPGAPTTPTTPSTPSGPSSPSTGGKQYRGPGNVVPPGTPAGPATPGRGPTTGGVASGSSGERAVRESLRTKKMKSTTVVPEAVRAHREVLGKTFSRKDDAWIEEGFDAKTAKSAVRKVKFLSDDYMDLVAKSVDLARILALGENVIFSWEGVWYHVSP